MYRVQVAAEQAESGYFAETDPTGRYARFEEVLGKGAMKTVYKAIDEVLGVEVAWNQVKLNELLRSPDELQRLRSEVHLLSTLNHDSIMKFHTSWVDVDGKTFNFITEMFTSGTLRNYRKKYNRMNVRAIKNWAIQILKGLVYLHGHDPPVIHRDLKCDNLFVNGHLGQVKIGDLGLAAVLRGSQSAHSVIGTPEFMAPELYEEDYNELVDVYSFGMCVLEMLTCEYPYSECTNPAQIYKKVTSGKLPQAFYHIKDLKAQGFVEKCLAHVSQRVSARQLLNDPFLWTDEDDQCPGLKLEIKEPILSVKNLDTLHMSDDRRRTNMAITGKLNPENHTIFLKVQIADSNGPVRNVYFPFDILSDTPMDVATEMIKELDIVDWEAEEIAEMIDGEISALVPDWIKQGPPDCYQDTDDGSPHPFLSFSPGSSSQGSASTLTNCRKNEMASDVSCFQDMMDDTSSQSSFLSGTYSNPNYFSVEDHEDLLNPLKKDQYSLGKSNKAARFCGNDSPKPRQIMARTLSAQCRLPIELGNREVSGCRLSRNRSLIDVQSRLLHLSLLEEVNKRRLFKTVGAVENIGFQLPFELSTKASQSQTVRSSVTSNPRHERAHKIRNRRN